MIATLHKGFNLHKTHSHTVFKNTLKIWTATALVLFPFKPLKCPSLSADFSALTSSFTMEEE